MKFISKTFISRGLLGLRKGWSLLSKGLLDDFQFRPDSREISDEELELVVFLEAKKQFEKEVDLTFCGKKVFEDIKEVEILGSVSKKVERIITLSAKKLFEEKIRAFVVGNKSFGVFKQLGLSAKKLIDTDLELEIEGSKSIDVDKTLNISSQKSTTEEMNCNIEGGKILEFAKTVNISCRKDLTPIFLALDED